METGLNQLLEVGRKDRKHTRRMIRLATLVVIVLFCFGLCMRTTCLGFIPPKQEILNLGIMIKRFFISLFGWESELNKINLAEDYPLYLETVGRFSSMVKTAISGALLALSGAIYQNVFRNPIAAPTMIGVGSGINISLVYLVIVYSSEAAYMNKEATILSYFVCFLILGLVLLYGRFLGGKKFSVVEMLLAGSILTRIIAEIVNIVKDNLTDADLEIMNELSMNGFGFNGSESVVLFLGILAVSVLPVFLMRFSMNASCFSLEESRTLGVNGLIMNGVALICGTAMVITTMLYSGNIGMVTLMIPHFSRYLFGVNFKIQYHSCMLLGAGFVLFSRIISIATSFGEYSSVINLSTIVTLIAAPVFMVILASGRKGWE